MAKRNAFVSPRRSDRGSSACCTSSTSQASACISATIGRLLQTLKQLRDLGNTVIVVEHDEETIREADYVIDLGPGAGKHGGEVIASGSVDEIKRTPASITGQYLSGSAACRCRCNVARPIPRARFVCKARASTTCATSQRSFRLGLFVAVTGVSGSGKSTLVTDILQRSLSRHFFRARVIPGAHDRITGLEHLDKIIDIDQSPIGRTPRSNPATYTGVFTPVRELFAELPGSEDSRLRTRTLFVQREGRSLRSMSG